MKAGFTLEVFREVLRRKFISNDMPEKGVEVIGCRECGMPLTANGVVVATECLCQLNARNLECKMFGGENSLALNALMSALFKAAGGRESAHSWLEDTPKTSMVVELYQALKRLGFEIVERK